MTKTNFCQNYGINLYHLKILLLNNGLNLQKNYKNIDLDLYNIIDDINVFLSLNLEKKEVLLKNKKSILEKKKKIGLYKGYKFYMGLPMYNQRTKTNNRTSRKKLL